MHCIKTTINPNLVRDYKEKTQYCSRQNEYFAIIDSNIEYFYAKDGYKIVYQLNIDDVERISCNLRSKELFLYGKWVMLSYKEGTFYKHHTDCLMLLNIFQENIGLILKDLVNCPFRCHRIDTEHREKSRCFPFLYLTTEHTF